MTRNRTEEFWNALTHGIGGVLSIAGLVLMLVYTVSSGSTLAIVSAAIYGSSLILLYFASTIFHAVHNEKWKAIFRKVDHLCIYLLIAGTYTPVTLVGIGGAWGWTLFGVIWGLVVLGFIFKFSPLQKSETISLVLYAVMGWLLVIGIKPMLEQLSLQAVLLIVGGGLAYTSGIYFYVKEKIKYSHVIWHLFVMAGSALHFWGIYAYML